MVWKNESQYLQLSDCVYSNHGYGALEKGFGNNGIGYDGYEQNWLRKKLPKEVTKNLRYARYVICSSIKINK